MAISVDKVQAYKINSTPLADERQKEEKRVSKKVVLTGLGALGAVGLGIMLAKGKFKKKPDDVKKIIGKDPRVEKLTEEEKLKLIKELQAKTDNPDTKETIRKLVENGEWDKLP